MSVCNLYQAMERIIAATMDSPIAVFSSTIRGQVHCFYANTVAGKHYADSIPDRLIGIYHRGMNLKLVDQEIFAAINSAARRERKKISPRSPATLNPPQGDFKDSSRGGAVGGERNHG